MKNYHLLFNIFIFLLCIILQNFISDFLFYIKWKTKIPKEQNCSTFGRQTFISSFLVFFFHKYRNVK